MGRLISDYSSSVIKRRSTAFEVLARAIVGQQISVKAAQSVWLRFVGEVGPVNPRAVKLTRVPALRSCGLSAMKVEYLKSLADHFIDGRIAPRTFRKYSDDELIAQLTDVRGIGRWTAEMFLMFHLLRPNVFPVQDIGLQRAVERLYFNGRKLPVKKLEKFGERWQPYRSVATWYLWRSLDPIPVEY